MQAEHCDADRTMWKLTLQDTNRFLFYKNEGTEENAERNIIQVSPHFMDTAA